MNASPLILVVRDSALGDLLTAVPALRALRRAFWDHEMMTTCPIAVQPLAEWLEVADDYQAEVASGTAIDPSTHPVTDRMILDGGWWHKLRPRVIVMLRVPEDPGLARALLRARPELFITYALPEVRATLHCPRFTFDEHILCRWSRLLGAFGITTDDNDLYLDSYLAKCDRGSHRLPRTESGLTVIHVGAASRARHWPVKRWAQVAAALERAGHRIVLTGSRAEAHIAARVRTIAGLPGRCDLTGQTDVLSLAALVAGARLVLSTDTGPAHLATAFRRPSVTLFGPVPPRWWGPPPGNTLNVCIWHGRYGDPYGERPDPGLLLIAADEVLATAEELEKRAAPAELPAVWSARPP